MAKEELDNNLRSVKTMCFIAMRNISRHTNSSISVGGFKTKGEAYDYTIKKYGAQYDKLISDYEKEQSKNK